MQDEMPHTEAEWKQKLTPEQYRVLREKGTDAPFKGALLHEARDGTYRCAACGNALFASDTKFDSGSGWPSFDNALPGATKQITAASLGMSRSGIPSEAAGMSTEVVCAQCGSHLGHLFQDGPTATGNRYCVNSVCLEFAEDKK
ncbi:MAG: peptide-methionine (R)-S-oxide reductase MsrB [bacterium]|nr:peptide-methionine (R)-S-oxide reductase MsrB [bacterium]